MENFDSLLLRHKAVVNANGRMQKPPYVGVLFHGRSQPGKAFEKADVVEERNSKSMGGSWMLIPRPIENLFEVFYGRVRVENLVIH